MGQVCCRSPDISFVVKSGEKDHNSKGAFFINALLNRWRSAEVSALQRKFADACFAEQRLLNETQLISIFPQLKESACENDTKHGIFLAFDLSSHGAVDFRDFCSVLAICIQGTRLEKLTFLFDIFAHSHLSTIAALTLLSTETNSTNGNSKSPIITPVTDDNELPNDNDVMEHTDRIATSFISAAHFQCLLKFLHLKYRRIDHHMGYAEFTAFAAENIPDAALQTAFDVFNILPGRAEERSAIEAALCSGLKQLFRGSTVYVIDNTWWTQWCMYTNCEPIYDSSGFFLLGLRSNTMVNNAQRPDVIDNTHLLTDGNVNTVVLAEELQLLYSSAINGGEVLTVYPFRFLCAKVWEELKSQYGGGPSIPTIIGSIVGDISNIDVFKRIQSVYLDVNPIVLQGFWASHTGIPISMAHDVIAYRSETKESLLLRVLYQHYAQSLSKPVDATNFDDNIYETVGLSILYKAYQAGGSSILKNFCRIWALQYDASMIEDQAPTDVVTKANKFINCVRFGPLSWWMLAYPNDRDDDVLHNSMLQSCKKILIEFKNVRDIFPMNNMIEGVNFRQFKLGDRVDARDQAGKWHDAEVVDVIYESVIMGTGGVAYKQRHYNTTTSTDSKKRPPTDMKSSPTIHKLRVHYSTPSKPDDIFYPDSHNLAPHKSYTASSSVQLPLQLQQIIMNTTEVVTKPEVRKSMDIAFDEVYPAAAEPAVSETKEKKKRFNLMSAFTSTTSKMVGSCGLLNLGNTCYMNCALQCLSHTPLLLTYFLSSHYVSDINKNNPLSSNGKIVEEFASLLRTLYSTYSYINPHKFKGVFEKYRPLFSGNNQHDAQEFLSEMLDCLHEDVNRIADKKYILAPEDDVWDSMCIQEQADDAWKRHLARNSSVIVELFQGQLLSEVICQTCHRVSRTFDPFMSLSLPLPTQLDRQLVVYYVPRMPHLPRYKEPYSSTEFVNVLSLHAQITKLCVSVPKNRDIFELKTQILVTMFPHQKIPINMEHNLTILEVSEGRMLREYDDKALISSLKETNDMLVAYESVKDTNVIANLPGELFLKREGGRGDSSVASVTPPLENIFTSYVESAEYSIIGNDETEGALVCDLARDKKELEPFDFNAAGFRGLYKGQRLDAMDERGNWYPAQVVAVERNNSFTDHKNNDLRQSKRVTDNYNPLKAVRIHFDSYASKWDEIFTDRDFITGRLKPLYSHSHRKLNFKEVFIVHRTARYTALEKTLRHESELLHAALGAVPTNGHTAEADMQLFGFPFRVVCESFRSCEHLYRIIVEQSLRYLTPDELHALQASGTFDISSSNTHHWIKTEKLPFVIRIIPVNDLTIHCDTSNLKEEYKRADRMLSKVWEGSLFPRDISRPICNLIHSKFAVAVDWDLSLMNPPARQPIYASHPSFLAAEEQWKKTGRKNGSKELHLEDCLMAFTKEERLDQNTWYCTKCAKHQDGIMRQSLYQLPDILIIHIKRFNMNARYREKIRSKVQFPLSGLNMSQYLGGARSGDLQTLRGKNGNNIYDLYAVINHLGGMNGGHYTSFIKIGTDAYDVDTANAAIGSKGEKPPSRPTRARSSSVGFGCDDKWMLFDDDYVEEVPPDRVVSDMAYVLFYHRRKLTPSNVINMIL